MAGSYGRARSNDIVPNGGIFPLADLALPGTLNLAQYSSANAPSVLNVLGSGSWNASTAALPTAGVPHAAGQEYFLPVNGVDTLYIQGSGSLKLTLHTIRSNPA